MTGSLHLFEELGMPDTDELELERNNDGDEAPKPSCKIFDLSQLVVGRKTNNVDGIGPTNDAACT